MICEAKGLGGTSNPVVAGSPLASSTSGTITTPHNTSAARDNRRSSMERYQAEHGKNLSQLLGYQR